VISQFEGSQKSENIRCFLDKLKGYEPNFIGNLMPKPVEGLHGNAQWLSGIAAGAWYELHETSQVLEYRYRRISPYGNIDVDAIYIVESDDFDYQLEFEIVHYSNCKFFHIEQRGIIFRFERKT
jgi:hypothetical protein